MLESIIIISLLCSSIHLLTREDALFSFWQNIICDDEKELRSELFNPVTECLSCMSSFWTCTFLLITNQAEFVICLKVLACFLLIMLISMINNKKTAKTAIFLYLVLVVLVLFQAKQKILSLTILMSVHGLNTLIGKALSFFERHEIES